MTSAIYAAATAPMPPPMSARSAAGQAPYDLADHAAAALGADAVYSPQYRRAHPEHWPGAALARAQPHGE